MAPKLVIEVEETVAPVQIESSHDRRQHPGVDPPPAGALRGVILVAL